MWCLEQLWLLSFFYPLFFLSVSASFLSYPTSLFSLDLFCSNKVTAQTSLFRCFHTHSWWLHLLSVFLLALPLSIIIFTIPLMSWCFSLWQRQSLKKKKERKSIIIHLALYMLSINWIQNRAWNKNAFLFSQWKEILHLHKMLIATSGGQTHIIWVVLIFSKFSKSKVSK